MRFDYTGRGQSEGRVKHEVCGKLMLGTHETQWSGGVFCNCYPDEIEVIAKLPDPFNTDEITDTMRLEWMIESCEIVIQRTGSNKFWITGTKSKDGYESPREAIDAAMSGEKEKK